MVQAVHVFLFLVLTQCMLSPGRKEGRRNHTWRQAWWYRNPLPELLGSILVGCCHSPVPFLHCSYSPSWNKSQVIIHLTPTNLTHQGRATHQPSRPPLTQILVYLRVAPSHYMNKWLILSPRSLWTHFNDIWIQVEHYSLQCGVMRNSYFLFQWISRDSTNSAHYLKKSYTWWQNILYRQCIILETVTSDSETHHTLYE